ncbi:MAG: PaaI family thioesterase [Ferruginibacter sp.]
MSTSIWFHKQLSVAELQFTNQDTMAAFLEMEWVEIADDFLVIKMPVTDKCRQPYGILHGGASCALAETVGSVGSHLIINPATHICVGLEINANHIRSVKEGFVIATARPLHIGGSTHVWDVKITDDAGKLICVSRLTVAILAKRE